MGYYVNTTDVLVTIPAEKLPDAFAAVLALDTRDDLKSGGGYSVGTRHFSWMPDSLHTFNTLEALLSELGFDGTWLNKSGTLVLGSYDSKTGDEIHFLRALAPFIDPDSYIDWQGEDGEQWRWEFNGKQMRELQAIISWTNATEWR